MMDTEKPVFGYINNEKVYVADPHDMERAKRRGRLVHTENGLAFWQWKGVTYVAPIDHPPLLRFIKGGRDP